ncbi:MAG: S-formylglutathione hydrolase [Myxococcales bacterium]|jgi:S-formylglutathione hydrolase|nr:MAG: S-formylglutathione hydrolase [Myxococcales bacterium]
MPAALETVSESRCFGGVQGVYRHASECTGTAMELSVFVPGGAHTSGRSIPVLYWLSGLTCTWENFTLKAGAQRYAAEHGIAIVAPDTSPRGLDLPGEHDDYDFGSGAGFYVDATEEPWARHYRMYSYVTEELPALVEPALGLDGSRRGVFGHSMGGHGALVVALRNPDRYRSVSAFAPIVAPSKVPWGEKALARYLGPDREGWKQYDACELVAVCEWSKPILVDQGDADDFLERELQPERFVAACEAAHVPLELRMQAGYDHSYYFIASFVGEHVAHHAAALCES